MATDPAVLETLPGSEIVVPGLRDLEEGRRTEEADAVLMASERLRAAGLAVPVVTITAPASHRLYEQLAAEDPDGAHSRYNAIVARVASFARALERAQAS